MRRLALWISIYSLLSAAGCATTGGIGMSMGESPQVGMASYYHSKFHGRPTASGETYNESELTGAHLTLPFGTHVRVTNLANHRSVVVRINDRGPFTGGRVIDVSRRAASELGFLVQGTTRVLVDVLGP